ncbi:unnamed protein product [Darwinula stevensoni]|uniref:Uncharacterized protein n=1 Tax=Darwinula stevensoni TaxID=69355 RepID=A0A7R9A357_9CRUS|nr:unnamed protein product [Darwinula stevensoni]CAG0887118.1 unnamed protein product [Darwinula stevensoni]
MREEKHIDHRHMTGDIRGATHPTSNLEFTNAKESFRVSIHNGGKNDLKLILKGIADGRHGLAKGCAVFNFTNKRMHFTTRHKSIIVMASDNKNDGRHPLKIKGDNEEYPGIKAAKPHKNLSNIEVESIAPLRSLEDQRHYKPRPITAFYVF